MGDISLSYGSHNETSGVARPILVQCYDAASSASI